MVLQRYLAGTENEGKSWHINSPVSAFHNKDKNKQINVVTMLVIFMKPPRSSIAFTHVLTLYYTERHIR